MNMGEAIRSVWGQYVTFSGRAVRSEFWYWVLFTLIAGTVLGVAENIAGWESDPLTGLFGLATLLPNLAVSVRRLHDTDRTGWWLLIVLVPIVGWLVLVWFYCQKGTEGANRFG